MAKLKANEVLQNTINGETPMSVDDGLTQLQRDTIALKDAVATAKATREGLDVKVRQSTMAVEEAITARRLLSARIAEGEDITDQEISAALARIETARERVTTYKEAIPAAAAALTLAQRALFAPLIAELRLRVAATLRRQVELQELTEANNARFAGIKKALDMNELFYVEAALAEYPPLPELAPVLTAVAAE